MTKRQLFALAVGWALVVGLVFWGVLDAKAESRRVVFRSEVVAEADPTYPKTRSWQLGWVPGVGSEDYHRLRVDVIETAGSCLYVAQRQSFNRYGDSFMNSMGMSEALAVGITAVPKTQLKPGVGCQ